MQEIYDETYYKCHCGPDPYMRTNAWLQFFGKIAEEIVRSLAPRTVFDAGCAWGFLVEALWDRGIEVKGVDISQYAIGQVRRDMQPFCHVGSLTTPIEGTYDLVTCIEVLEHIPLDEAEQAVANLCQATDTILFSSSPTDLTEETHINVQPTIGWLKLFAKHGFVPDLIYDASFLVPHAILFRRQIAPISEDVLVLFSEKIRLRVAMAEQGTQIAGLAADANRVGPLNDQLSERCLEIDRKVAEIEASRAETERLRGELEQARHAVELVQAEAMRHRAEADQAKAVSDTVRAEGMRLHAETDRMAAEIEASRAQLQRSELETSQIRVEALQSKATLAQSRAKLEALKALKKVPSLAPQAQDWYKPRTRSLFARVFGRRRPPTLKVVKPTAELEWNPDAATLASSELFDADWYLKINTDVAQAGTDPIQHYLLDGAAEGRDPGPRFSTQAYLDRYPAVREAGLNPLVHYLEHGHAAGHAISTSDACNAGPAPAVGTSAPEVDPAVPASGDLRLDREAATLASSELFDADWYLKINTDVAQAGTDPIQHYLLDGAAEGRDPGPRFSTQAYLDRYPAVRKAGLNPLVHYLEHGHAAGLALSSSSQERTATVVIEERFRQLKPLPIFRVADALPRVVMVTDSVNSGSLYGGVGTALILTAFLAQRLDRQICIATRTEAADQDNIGRILRIHNVPSPTNIEFVFVPPDGNTMLPFGDSDLIVTTSWWTTHSAIRSVPSKNIIYLIQEDERMFYAYGDEHLLCCEQLSNYDIRYVVNSDLLLNHFDNSDLPNIVSRGEYFEPCFPLNTYHFNEEGRIKLNFMFYARPYNARNLFYRGLEVINTAIERGILNPEEWNFRFMGKDLQPLSLAGGVTPTLHQNIDWSSYAALVRETDLALSLMYTPHPSYPPLDVVASGGVAVTNGFATKTSLERYSDNLFCVKQDVDSLVQGLEDAVRLVKDRDQRRSNYNSQPLRRDWSIALAPAIDFILKG